MTRYLLDTNVLIDIARGDAQIVAQVEAWFRDGHEVGISAVQIAEFFSGVAPANRFAAARFLATFACWPLSDVAARRAGTYRYAFARRGIQLAIPDMLIAGQARALSATLVTSNVRDFPMGDIRMHRL